MRVTYLLFWHPGRRECDGIVVMGGEEEEEGEEEVENDQYGRTCESGVQIIV